MFVTSCVCGGTIRTLERTGNCGHCGRAYQMDWMYALGSANPPKPEALETISEEQDLK